MHKADQPAPAGSNELQGTVVDASYQGVSTSYVVESPSGARLTIYEQNVERTVHGSLHRPGETVRLSWSPDHTFVVRSEPLPADQGSPA
jgi:spermidine/putrescine transport system ATP-binding protein